MIKIAFTLILIAISSCQAYCQDRYGDIFDENKFPADSFCVKRITYSLGDTKIILILLHSIYEDEYSESRELLWMEQRRGNILLKCKGLGSISGNTESGCSLPRKQILKDFFLINCSGEFSGIFYLITPNGVWYEIPGASISLDKENNTLYTYVPNECGGCTVAKFDLSSRKITKKGSDGLGTTWQEVKDRNLINLVEKSTLISWQNDRFLDAFCSASSRTVTQIVLATKLNLRQMPDAASKILDVLPFNAEVEVLDFSSAASVAVSGNISSYWVRVRYGDQTGYVASYYLGNKIAVTRWATLPITLRYRYWYKINMSEKGDSLTRVDVELDSVEDATDRGQLRYYIMEKGRKGYNDDRPLLFGSNNELKEDKIGDFFLSCVVNRPYDKRCDRIRIGNEGKQVQNLVFFERDDRFKNFFLKREGGNLIFSDGNIEQTLPEVDHPYECDIEWYGDFDSDGKPDFVLHKMPNRYLFLSAPAENGNLVKLVSVMEIPEEHF